MTCFHLQLFITLLSAYTIDGKLMSANELIAFNKFQVSPRKRSERSAIEIFFFRFFWIFSRKNPLLLTTFAQLYGVFFFFRLHTIIALCMFYVLYGPSSMGANFKCQCKEVHLNNKINDLSSMPSSAAHRTIEYDMSSKNFPTLVHHRFFIHFHLYAPLLLPHCPLNIAHAKKGTIHETRLMHLTSDYRSIFSWEQTARLSWVRADSCNAREWQPKMQFLLLLKSFCGLKRLPRRMHLKLHAPSR